MGKNTNKPFTLQLKRTLKHGEMLKPTLTRKMHAWQMARAHRLGTPPRGKAAGNEGTAGNCTGDTSTIYPVCRCSVLPLLRIRPKDTHD